MKVAIYKTFYPAAGNLQHSLRNDCIAGNLILPHNKGCVTAREAYTLTHNFPVNSYKTLRPLFSCSSRGRHCRGRLRGRQAAPASRHAPRSREMGVVDLFSLSGPMCLLNGCWRLAGGNPLLPAWWGWWWWWWWRRGGGRVIVVVWWLWWCILVDVCAPQLLFRRVIESCF